MNPHTTAADPSLATLQARRASALGPAYRHFYDVALQPVRGQDVWLYDTQGTRYLDCYNNVPSVGHCHPHVVAALSAQAQQLNTHTRYVHELVVRYAERLVGHFPDALDVAMFTCTGSEANDLALRIAGSLTGRTGIIVTEHAYHGVTMALADLSPSLQPIAAHVRTVRAPDRYRSAPGIDVAQQFAQDVRAAIDSLQAAGLSPAALIVDTVFASDGIFAETHGALSAGAAEIRAAGGLFIADEVQGGFCRTGRHWWAFSHEDGLVPDIVTMGKPMGGGHPIGALVIQSPLVAAFGKQRRYFNTFGGNTVSAAVGMAVMDVLEQDGLAEQVDTVGAYLRQATQDLASIYPVIGDVRGRGLYLGVELINDSASMTPAADLAHRTINRLRQQGVLIGASGPHANVLKIRPPLTFKQQHADLLVQALDDALRSAS